MGVLQTPKRAPIFHSPSGIGSRYSSRCWWQRCYFLECLIVSGGNTAIRMRAHLRCWLRHCLLCLRTASESHHAALGNYAHSCLLDVLCYQAANQSHCKALQSRTYNSLSWAFSRDSSTVSQTRTRLPAWLEVAIRSHPWRPCRLELSVPYPNLEGVLPDCTLVSVHGVVHARLSVLVLLEASPSAHTAIRPLVQVHLCSPRRAFVRDSYSIHENGSLPDLEHCSISQFVLVYDH